jgi:hypothetical protein
MTSVNTILESVGINHAALAAQVKENRLATDTEAPTSHYPVEFLACALEQLAARLEDIAEYVEREFEDYYVGGTCMAVFDMATGRDDKDPIETVRSHLGLWDQALLTSSPVFGHPELRCVNHTVLDHGQGTFTLTSYLVDVHSGDVTPVPGGPTTGAADAA